MNLQDKTIIENLSKLQLEPLPEATEKINLVRELLKLGRDQIVYELQTNVPELQRSSFLHDTIADRVKEIGYRLWEITKDSDPEFMLFIIQNELTFFPKLDKTELEIAWNGIGLIKR